MSDRLMAELLILSLWATGGSQPPQWFYDEVVHDGIGSRVMERFEAWAVTRGLMFPGKEATNTPMAVYDIVAGRYRRDPVVDDPVYRSGRRWP